MDEACDEWRLYSSNPVRLTASCRDGVISPMMASSELNHAVVMGASCWSSVKTVLTPQTSPLIALAVASRAKAVEIAFLPLYFANQFVFWQPAGIDMLLLGEGANFLQFHGYSPCVAKVQRREDNGALVLASK